MDALRYNITSAAVLCQDLPNPYLLPNAVRAFIILLLYVILSADTDNKTRRGKIKVFSQYS